MVFLLFLLFPTYVFQYVKYVPMCIGLKNKV